MLSRRDQLYIQPWEQRRFKDHRSKVHSALPVIDARAPPPRPHVAAKPKRRQREAERARAVVLDNFALLQRLRRVMGTRRLDNRWVTPQPTFHHKVGVYFDAPSLQSRLTARSGGTPPEPPADNLKCYACHLRKKCAAESAGCSNSKTRCGAKNLDCLPSIYLH